MLVVIQNAMLLQDGDLLDDRVEERLLRAHGYRAATALGEEQV
eukprot:CAMPEP_0118833702 /NCGR_PEP_ID=MMETSP1162-20130426/45878_1 /TAXON_ID=33656 /ORGANISM="Phaeocystis Sp, Strain CCMP2710" /LENGTH=42 /DNA_ID= /DNA_START= /DNA_END= /DNA_ORIENTATION=